MIVRGTIVGLKSTVPNGSIVELLLPAMGGHDVAATAVPGANGNFSFADMPAESFRVKPADALFVRLRIPVDGKTLEVSSDGLKVESIPFDTDAVSVNVNASPIASKVADFINSGKPQSDTANLAGPTSESSTSGQALMSLGEERAILNALAADHDINVEPWRQLVKTIENRCVQRVAASTWFGAEMTTRRHVFLGADLVPSWSTDESRPGFRPRVAGVGLFDYDRFKLISIFLDLRTGEELMRKESPGAGPMLCEEEAEIALAVLAQTQPASRVESAWFRISRHSVTQQRRLADGFDAQGDYIGTVDLGTKSYLSADTP